MAGKKLTLDERRRPIVQIGPSIAYVPLTKGLFALIDSEMAPLIDGYLWAAQVGRNYRSALRSVWLNGKNNTVFMHHAVLPRTATLEVDHINRNPLDNRLCNLRLVTHSENIRNTVRLDTKHGCAGIRQRGSRWEASISIEGKRINLGHHDTKEAAIEARRAKERKLASKEGK